MVKNLSSFFKKDSAGPVVIMTQPEAGSTAETTAPEAPAETPDASAETATTEVPEPTASAATAPGTQVSISSERLAALEGFERELTELKPKYEILNTWYNNVKGQGASVGKDASETSGKTEAKSWEKAPWNN
ncbi:hypothetical protein [Runella sp.]|uniref:hypothetical protein n=1 Tax=Runella sp. TaxID=1960881 RepID=UPI003D10304F